MADQNEEKVTEIIMSKVLDEDEIKAFNQFFIIQKYFFMEDQHEIAEIIYVKLLIRMGSKVSIDFSNLKKMFQKNVLVNLKLGSFVSHMLKFISMLKNYGQWNTSICKFNPFPYTLAGKIIFHFFFCYFLIYLLIKNNLFIFICPF